MSVWRSGGGTEVLLLSSATRNTRASTQSPANVSTQANFPAFFIVLTSVRAFSQVYEVSSLLLLHQLDVSD